MSRAAELLVAGLDVGTSSVRAWVAGLEGGVLADAVAALPSPQSAPHRVELDPAVWEASCRTALAAAVERAGRPGADYLGVTVSTPRQGFVLLDRAGEALGRGVLAGDRRGAAHAQVLAGTHALTGHGPAAELALPQLLTVQEEEPERWAATARVLFLHDWLVWRMTGVQATEASYACAAGMADVAARTWAVDLLRQCGLGTDRLAPVIEAGTVIGELRDGWGLPPTLPVVAGCGDTQLAATGVGGLGDGVLTVLAGPSTTVLAATAAVVRDPLGRPWVSTHAARGVWAVEGTGPGSYDGRPDATTGDVRVAQLEHRAFAVRRDVEDLERALGRRAGAVVVGGTAGDGTLPAQLAQVLGRDVHVATGCHPVARAGAVLVGRALGAHAHVPGLPATVLPAGDPSPHAASYARWCEVRARPS